MTNFKSCNKSLISQVLTVPPVFGHFIGLLKLEQSRTGSIPVTDQYFLNCFEKKFSTANLDPFELRVGLRIIILIRNSRTISPRTGFFCPIIRLPHFDNLNDRDERRLGEVLSCSGRF